MKRLSNVSLGHHAPNVINSIVEIPKGSRRKYRYNSKRKRYRVDYKFSTPSPLEQGSIPETIGENGSSLDTIIISRSPTRPGYVCQIRPIGTLKFKNQSHRVIGISISEDRYINIQSIDDLDNNLIKRIIAFFEPYFELDGWLDKKSTFELIKRSHQLYLKRKPRRRRRRRRSDEEE
jgi:inorganic pyrophosphatase